MFSLKNSTLPSKFNNLFLINSQIHNYNTRNAPLISLATMQNEHQTVLNIISKVQSSIIP